MGICFDNDNYRSLIALASVYVMLIGGRVSRKVVATVEFIRLQGVGQPPGLSRISVSLRSHRCPLHCETDSGLPIFLPKICEECPLGPRDSAPKTRYLEPRHRRLHAADSRPSLLLLQAVRNNF